MNNKELGKKAAKGVLGAATAVGVASAAGIDMSGIIRRISISLIGLGLFLGCLLYTSPSPRDVEESRMPSSA